MSPRTTAAELGTFDPTLLENGIHEIRLTALDLSRNFATTSTTVIVEGNQKVGNFTLSFKDLEVPVAGIPIQVIRTYDSRNKRIGDYAAHDPVNKRDPSGRITLAEVASTVAIVGALAGFKNAVTFARVFHANEGEADGAIVSAHGALGGYGLSSGVGFDFVYHFASGALSIYASLEACGAFDKHVSKLRESRNIRKIFGTSCRSLVGNEFLDADDRERPRTNSHVNAPVPYSSEIDSVDLIQDIDSPRLASQHPDPPGTSDLFC